MNMKSLLHPKEKDPSTEVIEEPSISALDQNETGENQQFDSNTKSDHIDEYILSSEYDDIWKNPESFQPENFSAHLHRTHKCQDLIWAILFWINFLVSFILFLMSKPWSSSA